jgi:phosphate transport system protein
MSHLDIELQQLKAETIKMWTLVNLQLRKGKEALVNLDKDLAREVILSERRVNAYELKLDRDCENIFALFNPVAVDLRCVLAVLKINNNLERTGDIVEGIAKFVTNVDNNFDKQVLEITRALEMYEAAINMMDDVLEAFDKENTSIARKVFLQDELLDDINLKANAAIADYIRKNPENIESALYLLSIIRKLERVGDQAKNMAEEIIFYIEAKVLKHRSKIEKQNNN